MRRYSSRTSHIDGELGRGWSHSFAWRMRQRREFVEIIDDWARVQRFSMRPEDSVATNAIGMRLTRTPSGFVLFHGTEQRRVAFGPATADGWHHMTRISDAFDNSLTVERDERGVLRGLVDAAGRVYRVTTDERGRVREVSVATGPQDPSTGQVPGWLRTISYTYDDEGDLVAAVDAEDHRWGYVYERHLMVEHQAASGLSIFYRYDAANHEARCIESWGEYRTGTDPALLHPTPPRPPPGMQDRRKKKGVMHVRLTYDPAGGYTEVETALGGLTRYFGDDVGRATKIVFPDGSVESRTFDPVTGGLVGVVERGGSARSITADSAGSGVGFRDAMGEGTERAWLPNRTAIDRSHATGAIVERQFDSRGLITFVKHPDGTTEEWAYDHRGAVIRHVDRLGVVHRITHDSAGNCTRVERGDVVVTNEYDYLGRRTTCPGQGTGPVPIDRRRARPARRQAGPLVRPRPSIMAAASARPRPSSIAPEASMAATGAGRALRAGPTTPTARSIGRAITCLLARPTAPGPRASPVTRRHGRARTRRRCARIRTVETAPRARAV